MYGTDGGGCEAMLGFLETRREARRGSTHRSGETGGTTSCGNGSRIKMARCPFGGENVDGEESPDTGRVRKYAYDNH